MAPCTLSSELNELTNITRQLQEADANSIYELTGCLASCERIEYAEIDGNFITDDFCYGQPAYDLHLNFRITTGSYKEEEQYIIYSINNFIGNVGGILGLCNLLAMGLLGCGVLTLRDELANLLGRFKTSTQ